MARPRKIQEQEQVEQGDEFRLLEFTISGSYVNSKNEIIDFENVSGLIPMCEEKIGEMHVQDRYATMWVKEAKKENGEPKYPERVDRIRQVFVDDIQETTGPLSFVGKSIKELNVQELQDLATAKDLRPIPLPNSGMSLREMRASAYRAYEEKINKKKMKMEDVLEKFSKLPDIVLTSHGRTEDSEKVSNEEIIELEQRASKPVAMGERDDPRNRFTIQELRTIADTKRIVYNEDTTFEELFSELFPA